MKGFRRLGEPLFSLGLTQRLAVGSRHVAGGETIAPTLTISVVSVTANVAAMQIVASEVVSGFAVGDITISAGGSLASFATADNITFTVSWTLASGANTMDINAGVCTDAAGNANTAATQYPLTYLVLQPDGTTGKDTQLVGNATTTNYGTLDTMNIGESNAGVNINRSLIAFDLSTVLSGSVIYSARLTLVLTQAGNWRSSNNRTVYIYRQSRAWVEAEATWNIFSTGNNWQTPGGFGAADCEQTSIGSCAFATTDLLGASKVFTLTPTSKSALDLGNGWLIKNQTETDDMFQVASSDNATAGSRPKLELVYHP